MLGAPNRPRMDEHPVGPRDWVARSPVGYKRGMRDGMGHGARTGVWHGRHSNPLGLGNHGMRQMGRRPDVAKGNGTTRGSESESAKQQPRGIGKPVAMEW